MSRRSITSNAVGIGVATGAYGLSFGAISVASGLDFWQTQTLSLAMFTGASQFALVGVLGAGGGMVAAVITALLLGARNGLYAMSLSHLLRLRRGPSLVAAQLTIDESTAMAIRHGEDSQAARHAFWATGLSVFVLWNIGTAIGAVGATAVDDPAVLGLDAAIPAGFIALLWPRLTSRRTRLLALCAALMALVLVPFVPAGVPVLGAAAVALGADALVRRRRTP
ncbi:MAG: AzlC family ABC transporter permease [Actinomycetota bacterium]